MILCLRGTLLASRRRKIERKRRLQGTRFALRKKIIMFGLFSKHVIKFYCLTQRHRWRARVFCLWLRRSRRSYQNYRSSRNDCGDRGDPGDHMETRLHFYRRCNLLDQVHPSYYLLSVIYKRGHRILVWTCPKKLQLSDDTAFLLKMTLL